MRRLLDFAGDDRHLVFSPLYHSAPLRFAMCTLLRGGTVILPGRFDPSAMLDVIARHRPTTAFCVPTQLRRIFAASAGYYNGFRTHLFLDKGTPTIGPSLTQRSNSCTLNSG